MINLDKTCLVTLMAVGSLLFASVSSLQAGPSVPVATVQLIAPLDGPNHAGQAEYVSTPLFRVFVAKVSYKVIGPDSSPVGAIVCVQRGAYMAKLGVATIDRPGTYSIVLDTRRSQVVPVLHQGDKIAFIAPSSESYLAKGVLKFPRIGPQ